MKNLIQKGNALDLTAPSGGVTSGTGYVIGGIFGVASVDAAVGESFALGVSGVYDSAKGSGDVIAEGAQVWFDNTAKTVENASATGLYPIGVAAKAAASGDATVQVLINVPATAAAA